MQLMQVFSLNAVTEIQLTDVEEPIALVCPSQTIRLGFAHSRSPQGKVGHLRIVYLLEKPRIKRLVSVLRFTATARS